MQQFTLPIKEIQEGFKKHHNISGWLIYDFKGCNKSVYSLLGFDDFHGEIHLTRRFFYWIPKVGKPIKIVHFIDEELLDHLPGEKKVYTSWRELQRLLESILKGNKEVAMEYSPDGMIPTISSLDAGTGEWIRGLGISLVSSWPLLEPFVSKFNQQDKEFHKSASLAIKSSMESGCVFVKDAISKGKKISEYAVQQHVLEKLDQLGYMTEHAPIIATGSNSAVPHYTPTASKSSLIAPGILLLDVWCKKKNIKAPYADHTMVVWVGSHVSKRARDVYSIVYGAQKKAIEFLKDEWSKGAQVLGFQVDDICRSHITENNFGDFFLHRTGHNIGIKLHDDGVNFDNFETHDYRSLTSNTCYSIEPGIYLSREFGVRLECNVLLNSDGSCEVTGAVLDELPVLSI